jgi:polyisoprenyl-teichoic acid--peptidoglycan teichoic acid transferase
MTNKSAAVAALLSFIFPGLGHLYLGLRRQALIFAVPAILVAAAIGLDVLRGLDPLLAFVISPSGALTILALALVTGGWRLIAMIDAVLGVRRRQGLSGGALVVPILLGVALVAGHGAAGYLAYLGYDTVSSIFVAGGPDDQDGTSDATGSVDPSGATGAPETPGSPEPQETDDYNVAPLATPVTVQSRINILLTGIDSAETRTTALTDTIMVVSVNPADKSVVMLSVPRDISMFPTYNGKTYRGKINSFMTWVRNHPKDFPDKPFPALMKQVGYLVGVPIHYYAALDLAGFRKMIDAAGGVTVDNPKAIKDPLYDWLDGTSGFYLEAGKVKLNGKNALAYARSRQGVGDSDFTRAARQQQLLVALRDKLTKPEMLTKLPDILKVAGDTVRTSLPSDRLEEFIKLAREVDNKSITREILTYPYAFHPPTSSTGGVWTLQLKMDRVAALSRKLFGPDSRYPED